MFTPEEVAEYYDTTRVHYQRWWNLEKSFSLHYGIWDEKVSSFNESLVNTNRVMMEIANITGSDRILDAGCGIGGAAFFLNDEKGAEVTGISLNMKQIETAKKVAEERNISGKVNFQVMDFTKTSFDNESFDVVWACESVCQAPDKTAFIKESSRILKKDGRLIVCDYFPVTGKSDKNSWMEKWGSAWAISDFISSKYFISDLKSHGFNSLTIFNFTDKIRRSSRRLFYTSLLGALPSELYNFFNKNVSRFAKAHYKAGYFQYRALKEKLWEYNILLAIKQ